MRRSADLFSLNALEPRCLLANTVPVFLDVDGDEVRVRLSGPGTVTPVLSAGTSGLITNLILVGTAANSDLSISVRQAGGGDGRVELQDMDSAPLRTVTALGVDLSFNGTITLTEARSITLGGLAGDGTLFLNVAAGRALSMRTRDVFSGVNIDVTGRVRSFVSDSFDATFIASERIDSFRSDGAHGDIQAPFFGSLNFGDEGTGVTVTATDVDDQGFSIRSYRGGSVHGFITGPNDSATPGRVGSIIVEEWDDGEIHVEGVNTLRSNGDFIVEFEADADGADEFAIRNGTVKGLSSGHWDFSAAIGTLRIATTDSDLELDGNPNTNVGTLAFTDPAATINGEFHMNSIRTLTARGTLSGDWNFEGVVPGTTDSIRTLSAARIVGMMSEGLKGGGIGTINTNHMEGVDLSAQYFRTVNIRAGAGGDGDFLASNLRAAGEDDQGFSIRSLTVRGTSDDSTIVTRSDVRSLTFGRFLDTVLFVGNVDPVNAGHPTFGDLTGFDPTRTLRSLSITDPFDAADPAFGDIVRITVGTLDSFSVRGATELIGGGTNGLAAVTINKITMKSPTGATIKPIFANFALGDTNPFAPTASDFVFRRIAP